MTSSGRTCLEESKRWYAVHALSGREGMAEVNLVRQGYASFVPRQWRTIRHARRLTQKTVPFFPGYMFVALDLAVDRWRSVNGTFGVRSLVMQGERPTPCPVGLVEQLMSRTDGDGLLDMSSFLKEGDSVKVASGPFADLVGRLEKLSAAGRTKVLLAMVHGEVKVEMDIRSLRAV